MSPGEHADSCPQTTRAVTASDRTVTAATATVTLSHCDSELGEGCYQPTLDVAGPEEVGADCHGKVMDVFMYVFPTEMGSRGMALTWSISASDSSTGAATTVSQTLKDLVSAQSAAVPFNDVDCLYNKECAGFVGTANSFSSELVVAGRVWGSLVGSWVWVPFATQT